MSEFRKAKSRIRISPGESVRIMRELQELSQNQLAEVAGIPQSTISAIERERVNLGVERAKTGVRVVVAHRYHDHAIPLAEAPGEGDVLELSILKAADLNCFHEESI